MKPAIRNTVITIASVGIFILSPHPNIHIIPQTKNPTNVGLDVVERVNLFNDNHLYPVLPYNRILNPCISDMQIHN
jgi:hypothetical protein